MTRTFVPAALVVSALCLPVLAATATLAAGPPPPQTLVSQSQSLLISIEREPRLSRLLHRARGLLLLPASDEGGAVIGGEGLVSLRGDGGWSDPEFCRIAAIDLGPKSVISSKGGSVIIFLMTPAAVERLTGSSAASLDEGARLSVVDDKAAARKNLGRADVVIWSDGEGSGGGPVGVKGITPDQTENASYYGLKRTVAQSAWARLRGAGETSFARDMDVAAGATLAAEPARRHEA